MLISEPLLKATLKVILDSQAVLYATILTHTMKGMEEDDTYHAIVDEYKEETAKLILEAMNAVQGDESSRTEYSKVREQDDES